MPGTAPWAVAVAPDRSIVTAGGPFIVDRRRPAGGPDRAFGVGGTVQLHFPGSYSDVAERIAVQHDGKVVVAGRVGGRCRPRCHYRVGLARLTRRGRLDRSFGRGGFAVTPLGGHAVGVVISHGRVYVAGASLHGAPELARLRRDGSLDRDFGRAGVAPIPSGVSGAGLADLAVQRDGRALLLTPGHSGRDRPGNPADGLLLRYRGDGSLDREFGNHGRVRIAGTDTPRGARAVAAEPDGGLLVARSLSGRARHVGVLRLRPDGSRDRAYRACRNGQQHLPAGRRSLRLGDGRRPRRPPRRRCGACHLLRGRHARRGTARPARWARPALRRGGRRRGGRRRRSEPGGGGAARAGLVRRVRRRGPAPNLGRHDPRPLRPRWRRRWFGHAGSRASPSASTASTTCARWRSAAVGGSPSPEKSKAAIPRSRALPKRAPPAQRRRREARGQGKRSSQCRRDAARRQGRRRRVGRILATKRRARYATGCC